MTAVVTILAEAPVALHLGRHLPARGRHARARSVRRQAVAAHAHSARPRHLRRRREQRPTIVVDDVNSDPRYLACSLETQLRDRRADLRRPAASSARSTSTATARRLSATRIATCSRRWRSGWRRSSPPRQRLPDRRLAASLRPRPRSTSCPTASRSFPATASAPKSPMRCSASSRPPASPSNGSATTPGCSRSRSTARRCRRNCSTRSARNRVALKGPVTTPIAEGFTSVNVGLRKALDLFANLRPVVEPAGRAGALQRRRPDHRPREHRGPVCRARARGRAGRRREPEDHHRAGVGADRAASPSSTRASAAASG